jgi:putative ABC transport system permease protein
MMSLISLVFQNCLRNKSRFFLTCISVLVAFFLFTILVGINNALSANVSGNNQYRLMTSHKISITRSLALNYQQKIAAVSGVERVSYASWFGGYFQDEKHQLAMTAVEHNSYFDLFDEYIIPQSQLTDWKNTRTGVIIGQELADEFGWKLGDKIPISSSIWMNRSGSFSWDFIVSGIYQNNKTGAKAKKVFFQHVYFDKGRAYGRNSLSWLSTLVKQGSDIAQVSTEIDALFANATDATRTITEQVFIKEQAQQFVDMAMIIKVVVVAVFFTLLLIVCNTMMQVYRERLYESAMMKTLGFSSSTLIGQLYFESVIVLAVGALIGSVLAHAFLMYLSQYLSDFLPGISLDVSHYFLVSFIVLIAAFICSFLPALNIKRLVISQTLAAH